MPRSSLVVLLLASVLAAQAEPSPPPKPSFAELEREFDAARTKHTEAMRAASQAKDQAASKQLIAENPALLFGPRFVAGAKAHEGTAEAVPFLVWLAGNAHVDLASDALVTLVDQHVDDARILPAIARLGAFSKRIDATQARAMAARVLEHNHDAGVQMQMHFTRASLHVGTRARERSAELRQQAIADLRAVLDGKASKSLRGLAESLLYEAENLEPGLQAPEIEGEDLDGVKFKLSDYRGKVVLLDFWGDW